VTVDNASNLPQSYTPGEDWQSLLSRSAEILGYDLAKDESADDLVGVPFIITRVVFRPGVMRNKVLAAYVSCEIRVSPHLDLRLINTRRESSRLPKITSLDDLPFGPDAHVVFNDGSTGVYRDIVRTLVLQGYIELEAPLVESGAYGESSFDSPPGEWATIGVGTQEQLDSGFTEYTTPIAIYCPRGLRLSLYENDYTQTGKTRYLA
jgi:hypothetical protein